MMKETTLLIFKSSLIIKAYWPISDEIMYKILDLMHDFVVYTKNKAEINHAE